MTDEEFWILTDAEKRTMMAEKCMNCESMVEQVWHVDDGLWNKLSGYPDGNGLLCIRCFDRKAQEQGIYLYWTCQPNSFPLLTEDK